MHLEPFGRITKLGAKRAELVQKFVPRYCIGIFLNESTGSTPLDLKSCFEEFRTIWVHLGPFGCLTKLGAKRTELVQKFVRRSRIEIFRTERARSTPLDPIHPIGPYTDVFVHFVLFWCTRDHLVALRNSMQNGLN